MHDICWVQKPGNKFSPKTAFLDTLGQELLDRVAAQAEHAGVSYTNRQSVHDNDNLSPGPRLADVWA